MHPLISLETRMNLLQDSSFYRVISKLQQSPDLSMQPDLMRQKNLSQQKKKTNSSLLVGTWTPLFLLLLFLISFCHRNAADEAETFGAAKRAEMAIDHIFLVSDFCQLPCRVLLQFSPLFFHCCLCIWNFHCLRHRNEFVKKTVMSHRIHPFCSDVILMKFVSSSFYPWSRAFVCINNTSVFCLAFLNIAVVVSPLLFIGILQDIAAGIGTSNFLRAAFIMDLHS